MTIANVTKQSANLLPPILTTAQEAIHLPEVQEMLHKLSHHGLGIFMPHMHNEPTGEFQVLPDDVVQVESGLAVSFQPKTQNFSHVDRFLPVGWFWRKGASTISAVCEMEEEETPDDDEHSVKHKMAK